MDPLLLYKFRAVEQNPRETEINPPQDHQPPPSPSQELREGPLLRDAGKVMFPWEEAIDSWKPCSKETEGTQKL